MVVGQHGMADTNGAGWEGGACCCVAPLTLHGNVARGGGGLELAQTHLPPRSSFNGGDHDYAKCRLQAEGSSLVARGMRVSRHCCTCTCTARMNIGSINEYLCWCCTLAEAGGQGLCMCDEEGFQFRGKAAGAKMSMQHVQEDDPNNQRERGSISTACIPQGSSSAAGITSRRRRQLARVVARGQPLACSQGMHKATRLLHRPRKGATARVECCFQAVQPG